MNPGDPYGLIGQVLDGQFRVDRFVGEGGFSVVYRGHHLGLDEPIAIKCLKLPSSLGSALVESFVRKFRDESRLHYRLSQGNLAIVRSIASGTTMSPSTSALVPYMVLEWLEGRSLAQEFEVRRQQGQRGRQLTDVVKLLDSAAQAIAYAHAQGVVHRDVNPGNLFLAQTRQGAVTKVLDFGVAKVISDHALELGPRAQTIGHIRIFAPAYGAPEQFDDTVGKVGPATDVYSFSLIVLESLRDAPVREGEHIGEFAMMALDAGARPTPRNLGIPVGDAVEEAFTRAVALKPDERPSDVGELWGSLKHAIRVDADSGRAPTASMVAPRAGSGWKPQPPAAGQAPHDRGVTADMPAPVVEVSRAGSVAPPPVETSASRPGVRLQNQTVRMQSAPPRPGEVSNPYGSMPFPPPGGVPSGAAALAATPLTSTLMMEGSANRILTPVPPTTRTGDVPIVSAPSPMANSTPQPQASGGPYGSYGPPPPMPGTSPFPPQAGAQGGPGQGQGPAYGQGGLGSQSGPIGPIYGAPPVPFVPRSEVATVVPPEPRSKGAIVALLVLVVLAVIAAVGFGVYRVIVAQPQSPSSAAPSASVAAAPPTTIASGTVAAVPPSAPPAPAAVASAPPPEAVVPAPAAAAANDTPAPSPAPAAPAPTPARRAPSGGNGASASNATPNVPTPAPVVTPAAPAGPHAFDVAAAHAQLDVINGVLASCRSPGGRTGDGTISMTFNPDGRAAHAMVDEPPFAGTPEGQCVASRFKQAKVTPFEGAPANMTYTFHVPKGQ